MTMETVHWFVKQKYNWSSRGMIEGDYDELTVIFQTKYIMVSRTLSNKIVSDTNKTLSENIVDKISSFFPIKKGVVVQPDKILPKVISLDNLEDVCEKIASLSSNNDSNFLSAKYEVITIAKAYLQTIGKTPRLTRSQFAFTRDELVENGTLTCSMYPVSEHGTYNMIVTFYGIIGYLLNDKNWMDTYLSSPTASFASNDNPDFHTHLFNGKEEKWIIGPQSSYDNSDSDDMYSDGY